MGCNIQIANTAFNRLLNSADRLLCDTDFRHMIQKFGGGGVYLGRRMYSNEYGIKLYFYLIKSAKQIGLCGIIIAEDKTVCNLIIT